MSATTWSKFFWTDWLSDTALRRCSPAARGLWMDMLCIAAQSEAHGYLAEGEEPIPLEEIARLSGVSVKSARRLLDELEKRRVLSRDDRGRIFCRRMVRDAELSQRARRDGGKGGNPNLIKGAGAPRVNPPVKGEDKPQKPEARLQSPASSSMPPVSALARAAKALGVEEAALRRRTGWIIFGDMIEDLASQGCDAERDVWPTIGRIAARLKEPPSTPAYFRTAILDARDRRRAEGGRHASAHGEWQDRLDVFAREGVWSSAWGPKPDIGDQTSEIRHQNSDL